MHISRLIVITLLSIFLAACASSNSGSVYSREDARKTQTVRTGTVESVRQVKLEGTKSPIGTVAGGAIGGIAVQLVAAKVARSPPSLALLLVVLQALRQKRSQPEKMH